jgi:uncharacterized SAM-binding protein YcdF (DUF218 family)
VLVLILHSGIAGHLFRYPLESRYPPLRDPRTAGAYDAIVVLTGGSIPADGLIPFPSIAGPMFRRLEEAWRLYRINPKPILVSGGHVDPFTPPMNENQIAREYLIRWGVPARDVLGEERSRDTFESAVAVEAIMRQRKWRRYLLVTSALHMPRSMLAFGARAPEPVPAPGDFTVGDFTLTPLSLFPSEHAAQGISAAIHEYVGLLNYFWRARFSPQR